MSTSYYRTRAAVPATCRARSVPAYGRPDVSAMDPHSTSDSPPRFLPYTARRDELHACACHAPGHGGQPRHVRTRGWPTGLEFKGNRLGAPRRHFIVLAPLRASSPGSSFARCRHRFSAAAACWAGPSQPNSAILPFRVAFLPSFSFHRTSSAPPRRCPTTGTCLHRARPPRHRSAVAQRLQTASPPRTPAGDVSTPSKPPKRDRGEPLVNPHHFPGPSRR
jgi:hypothetical protein